MLLTGISNRDGVVHKMSDKQFDAMLSVHLTGPFRLIRAVAPHMREEARKEIEQGKPRQNRVIVNISSISGLHGNAGQVSRIDHQHNFRCISFV